MTLVSRWASHSTARVAINTVPRAGGWAVGSTVLPQLSKFSAQLLTRGRPIVADVVSKFRYVASDFQLIFLEPGDVQLLSGRSPLKLTGDVLVIVADNSVQAIGMVTNLVFANHILKIKEEKSYLVMTPVVLTPSVLWVTRNFPRALMGA